MAREFIDGFESGWIDLWDGVEEQYSYLIAVATGVSGMSGGYCLFLDGNYLSLYKNVTARDEYYVAFKYRPTTDSSRYILGFYNGNNCLGYLRKQTSGDLYLEAYRGTSDKVATGTIAINVDTTYLIEVRYKPDDSNGIFQVKVDGVLDVNFTGDTRPTSGQINRLRLGGVSYVNAYFDDVIVESGGWIGDTCVAGLKPIAAGASTEWDPSAGDNFACVDDVPPDEADYVRTNLTSEIDLYAAENLSSRAEEVRCVQLQARIGQNLTPTPANIQLTSRTHNTNYFGDNESVAVGGIKTVRKLWDSNPNTSNEWSVSEVNDLEIGVKAA